MGVSHRCLAALAACIALFFLAGCSKTSTTSSSNQNNPPSPAAAQPATAQGQGSAGAVRREPSLVSLSAGAFPVQIPTEGYAHGALELLDERPKSAWRSADGAPAPHVFVLALPEKTLLKTVGFDCNYDLQGHEGVCAKDVLVEVSDASASQGFQKVAQVALQENADDQSFPVSASVPGRWVRLTIQSNHGSKEFVQLNEFRATGTQLTQGSPFPDISGTYESNNGDVHLRQEGTSVSGCYTYLGRQDNTLQGGVEGRLVKVRYCRYCGDAGKIQGSGVFVYSPDGKRFVGLTWNDGQLTDYGGDHWQGTKKSEEVGSCAQSGDGVQAQLTKDLEEFGRARVYGINFDTDSDQIKPESKPTLDKIAAMLKAKPEWKVTIEGHTDSTSTPEHNQALSERRAASVKSYLQAAGIGAERLTTMGYGATRPIADNDTELGRAQNRRVELVKQ